MPHLVGDRAEILPHDEAAMPVALEGEQAHERVERVIDIGAFRGLRAGRHPEEPPQPHHMVDA